MSNRRFILVIVILSITVCSINCYANYLSKQNVELKKQVKVKQEKINELQKQLTIAKTKELESSKKSVMKSVRKKVWLKSTNNSGWKPFMDYRLVTDPTSSSWKFIHVYCHVDTEGFLRSKDGSYCVALGSWFGSVGTKYVFTLKGGKEIKIVKAAEKRSCDTDSDGYLAKGNGHIAEFLLQPDNQWLINHNVILYGTVGVLKKFSGSIIKIEKVVEK